MTIRSTVALLMLVCAAALGPSCVVSFKDYPVGDLDAEAGGTGGGGLPTAGTSGDGSSGGGDGGVAETAGGSGGATGGMSTTAGTGGMSTTAGTGGTTAGTSAGTGGTGATTGGIGGMSTTGCGPIPPSCQAQQSCPQGSCCDSVALPGGLFNRGANTGFPATVSAFCLDVYEVTVGRFRAFVEAYDDWINAGGPALGAGEVQPGDGTGWKLQFSSNLPQTASALAATLACDPNIETWTPTPGGDELLPINCVNWFEAFAFCLWDGGRLPTETEWEYAAGHGGQNRIYPWGAQSPDATRAQSDCNLNSPPCTRADIRPVGSLLAGAGYWGQLDLADNLAEWTRDQYSDPFATVSCNNCMYEADPVGDRVVRGGSFLLDVNSLEVRTRHSFTPYPSDVDMGFRCARAAQ